MILALFTEIDNINDFFSKHEKIRNSVARYDVNIRVLTVRNALLCSFAVIAKKTTGKYVFVQKKALNQVRQLID